MKIVKKDVKSKYKVHVVVDSNIFISAFHFGGNPERILTLANHGVIKLFISEFILDEVKRILLDKFNWSKQQVQKFAIKPMLEIATLIEPDINLDVIPEDEDDNHIISCAVSAKADFLVSGDKHILRLKKYKTIKIVNSSDFLEILLNT